MGITVGGKTAWFVKSYGEFVLAMHWINGDPAMVIFPFGATNGAAYVLPLDAAHELVNPGTKGEGVNGKVLFEKAERAASIIGRGGDVFIARKIADAILSNLDKLCDMPPEPEHLERKAAPAGEAVLKVDGQTVAERTL